MYNNKLCHLLDTKSVQIRSVADRQWASATKWRYDALRAGNCHNLSDKDVKLPKDSFLRYLMDPTSQEYLRDSAQNTVRDPKCKLHRAALSYEICI